MQPVDDVGIAYLRSIVSIGRLFIVAYFYNCDPVVSAPDIKNGISHLITALEKNLFCI